MALCAVSAKQIEYHDLWPIYIWIFLAASGGGGLCNSEEVKNPVLV